MTEEKAGVFKVQVGNLPPNTSCEIRIAYLEQVQPDHAGLDSDGTSKAPALRFVLPTTLAPLFKEGSGQQGQQQPQWRPRWRHHHHHQQYRHPGHQDPHRVPPVDRIADPLRSSGAL